MNENEIDFLKNEVARLRKEVDFWILAFGFVSFLAFIATTG